MQVKIQHDDRSYSTVRQKNLLLQLSKNNELDSSTAQCRVKIPCRKVWHTSTARVPRSNAANIGTRKTWTQSGFCTRQNSVTGQEARAPIYVYILYSVSAQEMVKHSAKFG